MIDHERLVIYHLLTNHAMLADVADQLNDAGVQLTCVVNPHAPSGTLTRVEQLADLAEALNGVLLIDEAYANFIDPELAYSSENLVTQFDNVLILRTFSKGYSLAGLRLGYLLGSEALIDPIVSKTRDSYNIDHLSQMLGLAAFSDRHYAEQTWQNVRSERTHLQNNLNQLGLESPPSQANFLLVQVPETAAVSAEALYLALKERHILVRYFNTSGLDNRLRISVGTPEQNELLITALTELLT